MAVSALVFLLPDGRPGVFLLLSVEGDLLLALEGARSREPDARALLPERPADPSLGRVGRVERLALSPLPLFELFDPVDVWLFSWPALVLAALASGATIWSARQKRGEGRAQSEIFEAPMHPRIQKNARNREQRVRVGESDL